ncbi:unnamed protein product [Polarella glacialis]|uniref:Uncharacterized protein n=1 Tax=Polarella glacialis TaxID=89957 RepID=A0A813E5U7_POLGL|nr:unnamed protein product [Polarella glacialis]
MDKVKAKPPKMGCSSSIAADDARLALKHGPTRGAGEGDEVQDKYKHNEKEESLKKAQEAELPSRSQTASDWQQEFISHDAPAMTTWTSPRSLTRRPTSPGLNRRHQTMETG